MTKTSPKQDIAKLQRAIVDGLEDVKAHDIRVYDTEALSPLFERVMIASGTSNRQTRAIAASVVDAVQKAGFPKPRLEDTPGGSRGKLKGSGEWIIVDCGAAVAHVMQPEIRRYYNLEEMWGEKPVPLATTAERKAAKSRKAAEPGDESAAPVKKKAAAKKPAAGKADAPAQKAPAKTAAKAPAKKAAAAKTATPAAKKPAARKAPAKKATGKADGVQTLVVGAKPQTRSAAKTTAKPAAKKPAARKAATKTA